MKRTLCLIAVLVFALAAFVGCAPKQAAPSDSPTPTTSASTQTGNASAGDSADNAAPVFDAAQPFSVNDFVYGGLSASSTTEDATKLFGKPNDTFTSDQEASGDVLETWSYDFGDLTFLKQGDKLLFVGASIADGTNAGPRGIKIGDTFEATRDRFPHQGDKKTSDFIVYYSANFDEKSDIILPPSGSYDQKEHVLYYDLPVTPYGDDVKKDEESYVYQKHYNLTIDFDENGKIADYTLFMGTYAE